MAKRLPLFPDEEPPVSRTPASGSDAPASQESKSPDSATHAPAPPAAAADSTSPPGYRLHRLEVLNWGTFDGAIHSLALDGQTTLLVGQNGAGKSTLVDALLTLLVRPGRSRNYNLAAGANKTERSEKSYVLGAFDRRSQEDTNRGEVRYLRSGGPGVATYSVILACFRNAVTGRTFTLAQILYLSDDEIKHVYCFAPDDRSIARDCAGLKGMERLRQEMERRGFRATTQYGDYFEWFRRATGVKDQALDMFNQTVAVKDIQRLNDFIRKHMLEARPWGEKVDELFRHFKDLSDAHRELERVRKQRDALEPIETHGQAYAKQAAALAAAERLQAAVESYFPRRIVDLLAPRIAERDAELERTRAAQTLVKSEIVAVQDECRRLRNDVERAGGERLREIPLLVRRHEQEGATKRAAFERWRHGARDSGLTTRREQVDAPDAAQFSLVRTRLAPLRGLLQRKLAVAEARRTAFIEQRVEPARLARETEAELDVLRQRQGNLPSAYVEIRRRLCEELDLSERDLPFVAELIAVKASERGWESSLEMVLRNFALSLLVPERYYQGVSRYVDRTPLRDAHGHGQRLVYQRIAERPLHGDGPRPESASLFWKLDFREGWSPLIPWVRGEIQQRFDLRCCDTIEEFQESRRPALTKQRHVKHGESRHEKDDRARVTDPRNFVLGWDNKEKRRRLTDEATRLRALVARYDARVAALDGAATRLRRRETAVDVIDAMREFDEFDFPRHERAVHELNVELRALEERNDELRTLKARLVEREQHQEALQLRSENLLRREQELVVENRDARTLVARHETALARSQADGSYAFHAESFADLDAKFAPSPLTLDNFAVLPEQIRRTCERDTDHARRELAPIEESLIRAMGRFLNANPDERLDLDVGVRYLPDFMARLQRIRDEDLPRFEVRFKERLNEKVAQEIGVLRGNLHTERTEIDERIAQLNASLKQVRFGPGTHMRLVAKPVRDPEIARFRQELDACVTGQFEGTMTADEARFKQIESLLNRLRDEERWRQKVTDVRNWFDFAAVETDDATGEERSYHDDSAGQSGGEKAKLAFTILIAAIAFQYDLDPQRPAADRFHFVVVDEMFSRVDDGNSAYALELFRSFGLQLLIVAPLDAKARVTEDFVGCYLLVTKDERTNRSQALRMTAREFAEQAGGSEANADVKQRVAT